MQPITINMVIIYNDNFSGFFSVGIIIPKF